MSRECSDCWTFSGKAGDEEEYYEELLYNSRRLEKRKKGEAAE